MSLALATKGVICTGGTGGATIYIDRWHIEVPIEIAADEVEVAVDSDNLQMLVMVEEFEVAVTVEETAVIADSVEVDVEVCDG